MVLRFRFVLLMLAIGALACGSFPIGQPAPAPTATLYVPPTAPPIPTRPHLTPTPPLESPTPTVSAPGGAAPGAPTSVVPTATPVPGQPAEIVLGSLRDGTMAIYFMSAVGHLVDRFQIDPSLGKVVWADVSPDGARIAFVPVQGTGQLSNGIFVSDLDGGNLIQLTQGDGQHPRWSFDGSLIAYSCNAATDICVMTPHGGNQVNLTPNTPSADLYPSWVPDGRIVFMSSRDLSAEGLFSDIYIMDLSGANLVRLTTDQPAYNAYPSVSPDGSRIAYESDRDVEAGSDIYIMGIDGQNNVRITSDPLWNQNPVWSPDGTRLLYAAPDEDSNVDLYVVNADGTGATRLSANPAEDGGRRLGHAWLRSPVAMRSPATEQLNRWRVTPPRGTSAVTNAVLFATSSFNCDTCLETGIYTVSLDGSNLTPLRIDGTFPAWAPGFDRFAYVHRGELYIANANGSQPTQITGAVMNLAAPQWHRGGRNIVADCTPYGQHDVCLVDTEDGRVRNITPEVVYGTGIPYPYWLGDAELVLGQTRVDLSANITGTLPRVGRVSPDGARIAYIRSQQLYIANVDGSNEVRLTDDATTKGFPVWSPDNQLIIYTVAPGDGYLYLYAVRAAGNAEPYALVAPPMTSGPIGRPDAVGTWLGYSFAP